MWSCDSLFVYFFCRKGKSKSKRSEAPFVSAYGRLAMLRSLCKEARNNYLLSQCFAFGAARLNRTSRAKLLLLFYPIKIHDYVAVDYIFDLNRALKHFGMRPCWQDDPALISRNFVVLISFCSTWVWQLSRLVTFTSDFNSFLLPLGINYANNYVQTFLPLEGRLEAGVLFTSYLSPFPLRPPFLPLAFFAFPSDQNRRSPFSPSRMTRTPSYAG